MLHAVIMAGGSGTRFWPKSRRNRPKQLLKLFGDRSMLQDTVDRIAPMVEPDRVLVITGADQAQGVRDQLPEVPADNVVGEPCPRDTAPCVALAAAIIARKDPDGTMIVKSADHVIRPPERFRTTVKAAVDTVEADPTAFVTFGVRPTRPETGYGYIEQAEKLGEPEGVGLYRVAVFKEKPDLETAQAVSRRRQLRLERRHLRLEGEGRARRPSPVSPRDQRRPRSDHPRTRDPATGRGHRPGVPRDDKNPDRQGRHGALRERQGPRGRLRLVGRRRLALSGRVDPPRPPGERHPGPAHLVDSRGSVVIADDGHPIMALGLDDVVIVQSGGATLVARKDKLDALKKLVEGLDQAGHGAHL